MSERESKPSILRLVSASSTPPADGGAPPAKSERDGFVERAAGEFYRRALNQEIAMAVVVYLDKNGEIGVLGANTEDITKVTGMLENTKLLMFQRHIALVNGKRGG